MIEEIDAGLQLATVSVGDVLGSDRHQRRVE